MSRVTPVYRTEDEVRDEAKLILGFDKIEDGIKQGTGQITTFNQLGFQGVNRKPDGWYLPKDRSMPAIILETKSEKEDLSNRKWVQELFDNIKVVDAQYDKIIGILYNGQDIRVFKYYEELTKLSKQLQDKSYYLSVYNQEAVDKQAIYRLTAKINNCLHIRFGIKNLYNRNLLGGLYRENPVKSRNYEAVKSSKKWENVGNSYIIPALLLYRYSYI